MPSIRPVAGIRMGLVLAAALGLFVRFTVRDRYPWIDVAYYALQLPVIAYAMLAAGTLSSRLGQRGQATACFVLAFSLVLLWVGTGTTWNRCKATRPDFRALEWNICRGRAGWEGIVAAIRSEKADVIGLVEANVSERGAEKFWLERFPGYSVSSPGRGLVLLVRGKIEKIHLQEFGVRSKLAV